ncbi:FtsX-like permease family protein [Rugamonas sp.]|uniref:ABC transporter permease n=1 Tax=Rugamonas sp. TaxID=1926287 RepID=UPI0025DABFE3|nr:FtsX-like permease family protein [Rugamonas sp.]
MEIRPILSALLRNKTGAILIVVQVALSMAILSNALHIVQGRQAMAARASGVADEPDVFYVNVKRLRLGDAGEQQATQKRQSATLRGVAGVVSVANVNQTPLSRSGSTTGVAATRDSTASDIYAAMYVAPESIVKTWGLRLVEGRDFNADDILDIDLDTSEAYPATVIVTRTLAAKLWPGSASALGKILYTGSAERVKQARVVGVVDALQTPGAQIDAYGGYSMIVPARLTGSDPDALYAVRAEAGQRDRVMKEAEAALRAASAEPLVIGAVSMDDDRAKRYRADHALAWMLIAVSVLLLLITASGIVGMASLWVTQRRKQIGVRRALGARRIDILRYFITENIMITSIGVAAGVLLSLALNQLLVSSLEMARLPLAYLGGGAIVFWLLGVAAVYGPAWRAASTSPALATRST